MKAVRALNSKKKSFLGGADQFAVFIMLTAGLVLTLIPAEAAHAVSSSRPAAKAIQEKVAETAVKDVEATGAIGSDADPAGCSKSRKRLFVEGEGWIVRKVTICY